MAGKSVYTKKKQPPCISASRSSLSSWMQSSSSVSPPVLPPNGKASHPSYTQTEATPAVPDPGEVFINTVCSRISDLMDTKLTLLCKRLDHLDTQMNRLCHREETVHSNIDTSMGVSNHSPKVLFMDSSSHTAKCPSDGPLVVSSCKTCTQLRECLLPKAKTVPKPSLPNDANLSCG